MPLALIALLLLAAAPASAAPVKLQPASGAAGARTLVAADGLDPGAQVELRVGKGRVRFLRAGPRGRLRSRQRIPKHARGRVRVAIQEQSGRHTVLHYRVRSRWSGRSTAAAADWQGRVLRVTSDLRLGRLATAITVTGLAPGTRVTARHARERVGAARAGAGGRARIRASLPGSAAGGSLDVRWEGVRLAATLPTPPAVLAVAGDIACKPPYERTADRCRHGEVAELVERLAPDAVALPGDIQYQSGRLSEFRGSFDPTWGRLPVPLRPVPGNHEYRTPGARDYFDYFELQSGWRPPPWYAYDLGPWRLVALNSNCEPDRVDCTTGSEQERWLRANLATEPHRCTLAYWHHPRYSSGFHGSDPRSIPFWRALQEAGAELVISGHDHHYERFAPQDEGGLRDGDGMRQFVVGTGGSHNSVLREPRAPNSAAGQNRHFGVLLLRLYEDAYSWRFVRIPDGRVLDFGNASCR